VPTDDHAAAESRHDLRDLVCVKRLVTGPVRNDARCPICRSGWIPEPGEVVAAQDALGRWLRKVNAGPGGFDFPCWNLTWEGDPADEWTPWPIEDVECLAEHPDALTKEAHLHALD
jgi:hypothetical protein